MTTLAAYSSAAPATQLSAPQADAASRLQVRLAGSAADIAAAQALRYRIFYEEMGARPSPVTRAMRRDVDAYDRLCDHLLVIDDTLVGAERVVGTYRLLRQDVAERHGGFYSSSEFDISALLAMPLNDRFGDRQQLLELGRSCIAPDYRNAATISLLWHGIAAYLHQHNIGYMFGCASFPGTDPLHHAQALSFLHHNHLAPDGLRVSARPGLHVPMDMLPVDEIDPRAALRSLPPLIKGYLRLGCMIGEGGFIDHQFNTIDVFILLPVERITQRYRSRFVAAPAERH